MTVHYSSVHNLRSNLRKGFWTLIYSVAQPNVSIIDCYLGKHYLEKNTMGFYLSYKLELQECMTQSLNYTSCLWHTKLTAAEIHLGTGRMLIWKDWICKLFENLWHFLVFWLLWSFVLKMFLYLFNRRKAKAVLILFLRVFVNDARKTSSCKTRKAYYYLSF